MKENVIIGQIIPAGTGLRKYRELIVSHVDKHSMEDYDEEVEESEKVKKEYEL